MIEVTGFGPVECRPGQTILEALNTAGVVVESPCGGNGVCGKCLVRITRGPDPAPAGDEIKLIDPARLAEGYRLACLRRPESDLALDLPPGWKKPRILAAGQIPDFQFAPSVRKAFYQVPKRAAGDNRPADEWLGRLIGGAAGQADLAALKTLAPLKLGYVSGEKCCTVVFDDGRPLAVEPGDSTAQAYGLALDIGTTTMVMALVDLLDGRELAGASMINPQAPWGLDVLSRIAYAQEQGPEGLRRLQKAVTDGLEELTLAVCRDGGVNPARIYNLAVAANSTMLHLLLGLAPDSLGLIPFAPTLSRGLAFRGSEIGLKRLGAAKVLILPSVSAYIGADIVAGAYVCRLKDRRENVIFIDVGTNGEVILASHGRLIACSCAAGPAFEGMNIHKGMRASEGAIEDLNLTWNRETADLAISLTTIGDSGPVGLCGSGILAAVREFLKIGLLRPDGRLVKSGELASDDPRKGLCLDFNGKPALRLSKTSDEVIVTQKDIRQVQLAKGAILSALKALLLKTGLEMSALDRVIVAGQFGAYLPVDSLTSCGLVPAELAEKIEYAGNTSKAGAYMALMSRQARAEMEELASGIDYFELGDIDNYDRLFAAAMKFPGTPDGRR
ncbi:MAG: ASKHA domain-containing protein [Candidatus Adiutrix sp.]|jgi:uncharacterized 2Fe-2S/4Fe-4S cluster protein (DUF4445 family)|nr:ASKHA domain-containing protein [Candidatus Adiutrix sp.]